MRAVFRLFLTASATATLTLAAHASPTTFSLPEPTPTPTARPDVAGPADDTGVVPIAPRVIPTDNPTPATSPSPSTASPASQATTLPAGEGDNPVITPVPVLPTTTPAPAPTVAAPPSAAPRPGSTQSVPPQLTEPDPIVSEGVPGLDGRTEFVPDETSDTPAAIVEPDSTGGDAFDYWPWLAGFAALLALGIAGFAFSRRRKPVRVAEIEKPRIEPKSPAPGTPVVEEPATAPTQPAGNPRIDITLDVVSATRSVMQFTLDYRLTLANREAQAVRDIDVAVILTSARSNSTRPGELGYDQAEPQKVERIGPNKSHIVSGTLQLPVSQLQIMRQGNKPLFIPLVQISVGHGDGEPVNRHYAVGLPSTASASRVHPIPLDTPPGGIPDLRTRKLDLQPG